MHHMQPTLIHSSIAHLHSAGPALLQRPRIHHCQVLQRLPLLVECSWQARRSCGSRGGRAARRKGSGPGPGRGGCPRPSSGGLPPHSRTPGPAAGSAGTSGQRGHDVGCAWQQPLTCPQAAISPRPARRTQRRPQWSQLPRAYRQQQLGAATGKFNDGPHSPFFTTPAPWPPGAAPPGCGSPPAAWSSRCLLPVCCPRGASAARFISSPRPPQAENHQCWGRWAAM